MNKILDGMTPGELEPVASGQKEKELPLVKAVPSFAEARVAEIAKEAKIVTLENPEKKAADIEAIRADIAELTNLGGVSNFEKYETSNEVQEKHPSVRAFYESDPKLKEIGSAEMYENYIEALFPNTKCKDLVYRGTGDRDDLVTTPGTNQTITAEAIFFTSDEKAAQMYRDIITRKYGGEGKVHLAKINLVNPFFAGSPYHLRTLASFDIFLRAHPAILVDDINEVFYIADRYIDYHSTSSLFGKEETLDAFNKHYSLNISPDIFELIKLWPNERSKFSGNIDSHLHENYDGLEIAKSIDNFGDHRFDQFAVFDDSQINLLGSADDLERFKRFVALQTEQGEEIGDTIVL